MSWTDGPLDDRAILWLGVQVFWWKRFASALQVFFGFSVLATLLTEQQKLRIHTWFQEAARDAKSVRIPPIVRLRTIFKWLALAIVVVSGVIALLVTVKTNQGEVVSSWAVMAVLALLLAAFTPAVAALVVYVSLFFTSFRAGQRFVPPVLAWLLHHKRFNQSLVIAPFVLFVIISALQIALS